MQHPRRFTKIDSGIKLYRSIAILLVAAVIHGLAPAPAAAGGNDPETQITNYLLGLSSDPTGLDLNGDGKVTVADLVYYLSHRVPTVTAFAIAGGVASSGSRAVTLSNSCTGNPQAIMASEAADFSGAAWQDYSTAAAFTLSTGNGVKTVYFKVRDVNGMVSPVVTDTISLLEITPLTVGAAASAGNISAAGDYDWYQLTVTATSSYIIETFPGTLTDDYLRLFGPGNMTTLVAQDHNSSANKMARVALTLVPGTYYVRAQAFSASATGTYSIRVTDAGVLKVTSLAINAGAATAGNRTVTLNNACSGVPVQYMVSESAAFSDGSWQPYAAAPPFTLSAGNLPKTVYFKVKDAGGTVSPVASDTITLLEVQDLTVGDAAASGAIAPAGDADWYQFTVDTASNFVIETWPGTLTSNNMALYGPGSMTTLVTQDHNSSANGTARIAQTLAAGTYYAKVQAYSAGGTGSYTIQVADVGSLKVASLKINNGATLATRRDVTLNNTCSGLPTAYMASESSKFTGALWQPYATAPSFTLSAGNVAKKVYFKVKDASGTISAVVSDTINLTEVTPLSIDGTLADGAVVNGGDENWFSFTVKTAGFYRVQAYAGTLADTIMGLSSVLNASSSQWIANNDNISDSDLMSRVTAWLAPGTYYVMVGGATTGLTGTYTIGVSPPPSKALTMNGAAVGGTIASASDENWFYFTVSTTGGTAFSIETTAGTLEDGYMELYSGATSALIGTNDDATGALASSSNKMPALTAYLAAGTYLVRVIGYSASDVGDYTIKVRSGPIIGGTVSLVVNGPTASGTLKYPYDGNNNFTPDANLYQLIVSTTGTYTIADKFGTMQYDPMMTLTLIQNGQRTQVSTGITSMGGTLLPGTYEIEVTGQGPDYGTYQISVKNQ